MKSEIVKRRVRRTEKVAALTFSNYDELYYLQMAVSEAAGYTPIKGHEEEKAAALKKAANALIALLQEYGAECALDETEKEKALGSLKE